MKFHWQDRKVALIIDNCPTFHCIENLEVDKLAFSQPNTTSKTLPMDQVVILALKVYYHLLVVKRQLKSLIQVKKFKA